MEGAENAYGYIHEISPVKQSAKGTTRYFNAVLQEEQSFTSIVCFNPDTRQTLLDMETSRSPVVLQNISRVPSMRKAGAFDIKLTNRTSISTPIKKLNFRCEQPPSLELQSIAAVIADIKEFQKVTVEVKVLEKGPIENVTAKGKQLVLATLRVADSTEAIQVSCWQDDIQKITAGHSYRFTNATVRNYGNTKTLSISPDTIIKQVSDLQCVSNSTQNLGGIAQTITLLLSSVSCSQNFMCGFCTKPIPTVNSDLQTVKCKDCNHRQRAKHLSSVFKCEIFGKDQTSGQPRTLSIPDGVLRSYFNSTVTADEVGDLVLFDFIKVDIVTDSNRVLKIHQATNAIPTQMSESDTTNLSSASSSASCNFAQTLPCRTAVSHQSSPSSSPLSSVGLSCITDEFTLH